MAQQVFKNPNQRPSNQYLKIFEGLKNAGFDTYQDSPFDISAYDDGDAIRDFGVNVGDDYVRFKNIHVDEKHRNQGWGNKLIKSVLDNTDPNMRVEIQTSINDDFWNHMIKKYPNYKWSYK